MRPYAGVRWRLAVFLAALIAPIVWLGFVDPIPQDLGYHNFMNWTLSDTTC